MKTIGKFLTGLALLLVCGTASAQNRNINGVVKDAATGEELIGAAVTQRGTNIGTTTLVDGTFTLTLSTDVPQDGYWLEISYLGYEDAVVKVPETGIVEIGLQALSTGIEEIVVVGYGSQRVKDMTAPVTTVKGNELTKQLTSSATQALQGKVAGVQVISDGTPGSGGSVKIRGVGSIGDYVAPLYVVDGVFVDDINFLSTSDIADMTILKDASSAAIYGVRAANGVVLITTKRGTTDKAIVTYDGYAAVQVPVNIMPLASREQYVELVNEANTDTSGYVPKKVADYPTSTDWYGELVKPAAMMHSHSVDVAGRTDRSNYSLGVNYFYQDGIMNVKNDYERINFRARQEQKVSDWLTLGVSTVLSRADKNNPNTGAFFQAFVNPPVYPVYDKNNTAAYPESFGSPQQYGFGNSYGNPYATAYYNESVSKQTRLVYNIFADFSLVKNKLSFRISYNQDINYQASRTYQPEFLVGGSQSANKSQLSKTTTMATYEILDNLLTWQERIDNHSFSLLLGQSTRMYLSQYLTGSGIGAPGYDDQSKYLINTLLSGRNTYDGGTRYNGVSAFTRGTYNYADKYLATVTFRADGSSKYQQKWGFFPSIGAGWIISNEDFMRDQNTFQYLKLRASWGLLGNDNVPANSSVTLGTTGAGSSGIFNDELVDGAGALTVIRNYLKWEVVNELDLGIDYALLDNRLSGEIDYYRRVTENVVFEAPIASGGGTATLLANNGSVLNEGLELSARWNERVGDLTYNIGMNLTTIRNEVLSLEGRDFIPGATVRGGYTTRTAVGHSIGSFYGYEIEGVYTSESDALRDPVSQTIKDAGYFKYRNQNDDKVIDEKDKVYLGSAIPKLMVGLDFGGSYRNWDFSVALQGQFGNKVLNAKRMNRDVFADGNYDLDFYENCWRPDRKSDIYPSAEAYNTSFVQQANSFFVEDASYIRIQNVTVGYTFALSRSAYSMRVYLSAQRPYTFFGYNGFTPEIGGSPIASGIDTSVYPMQGIYSLGIKLNF